MLSDKEKQAIENLKEKDRLGKEEKARLKRDQDKILRQKRIDLEHAIIVARYYQMLEEDNIRKATLTGQIAQLQNQILQDEQDLKLLNVVINEMTYEHSNDHARRVNETRYNELSLRITNCTNDLQTATHLVQINIHFQRFCDQFKSDMGKPIWLDNYRLDVIWDVNEDRCGGKRSCKSWKTAPNQLLRPPKAQGRSNQGKWWNNAEWDDGHDDLIENDHEEDDTP